jgi:hypothetical protein
MGAISDNRMHTDPSFCQLKTFSRPQTTHNTYRRNEPHQQRKEAIVPIVGHEPGPRFARGFPDHLPTVNDAAREIPPLNKRQLHLLGVVAEVVVVARLLVQVQLRNERIERR